MQGVNVTTLTSPMAVYHEHAIAQIPHENPQAVIHYHPNISEQELPEADHRAHWSDPGKH